MATEKSEAIMNNRPKTTRWEAFCYVLATAVAVVTAIGFWGV